MIMFLYHGSNEIVSTPMILITQYAKDFSWVFILPRDKRRQKNGRSVRRN